MGLLGLWEDRGSTLIYVRNEKTIMNMQRHRRRSAEIVPGNLVKKLEVTSIPSPSIVAVYLLSQDREGSTRRRLKPRVDLPNDEQTVKHKSITKAFRSNNPRSLLPRPPHHPHHHRHFAI